MASKKLGMQFRKGLQNYRVAPELTAQVIEKYLLSLDCPRALTVWLMFKNNEHEQLANLSFDPKAYSNWIDLRDAYAASKFLSKYKDLTLDYDLDQVAITKFMLYEDRCKQTNRRFKNLSQDPNYHGPCVWLHHAVIRKVERILGDFGAEEFFSSPDWGPGASTLIPRRSACSQEKFQCETGITRDLYALIPTDLLQMSYPAWGSHLEFVGFPNFQVGNRVVTVPKDASTNRVIAIEPGINLWFQKSLGDMIGKRLLRVGIDLTDQSRNQQYALLGSKTGEYTTVDFSSASDSIATKVVEEVLPPRWFSVMDSCRAKYGTIKDTAMKWEKFSSMGNGFTFPLQSLIFYAVAKCCVEYLHISGDVSVYGDDVIIPTPAFGLFSELVSFYGFQINEKKSHFDSTFRESCGAHYASGFDVKPIFLKEKLTSVLTVYRLANAIRRLAHRRNRISCDARFRKVFELLIQTVPEALRLRIPDGFGDGAFISNFDEALPARARHGVEGHYVFHAVEMGITHQDERLGYLLSELWRLSKRETTACSFGKVPSRLEATRDITSLDSGIKGRNSAPSHDTKVKIAKSLVRQWADLGPWL